MARIDNHEPLDLEMTWGDEDEMRQSFNEPLGRPRVMDRYESRSWRSVFVSWAVAALLLFGAGTCTGNKLNDAEVRDLMLERTEAETRADQSTEAAAYWQQEAIEASATASELAVQLADEQQRAETYRAYAEEASSTIATLKQQKATPKPSAPKPVQASYGGGVEQWRPLVAAYFPADAVDEALLCISIESGGNPNAVSASGTYVGLFQMDSGWGSFEERTNPEWAIAVAASSYAKKGWAAWPPMKSRGF